ncbi:hypothetical protein BJ165DRAFT_1535091 [Panaeolus papilionaceus]|nr:hypothetical protein BJ165DRAFT_1535091 [Panaeolus papilionaceus]
MANFWFFDYRRSFRPPPSLSFAPPRTGSVRGIVSRSSIYSCLSTIPVETSWKGMTARSVPSTRRMVGGPSHNSAPSDSKKDGKGKERATSQGVSDGGYDASSSRSRQTRPPVAQTRPPGGDPACNCEDSKNRINAASRAPPVVDNYAQLSSLPEFRAFKLNQNPSSGNEGTSTQGRSRPGTSSEGMQQIHIMRRTKKQTYVRSGTEGLNIRMYKGNDKDSEDPEGGQKS